MIFKEQTLSGTGDSSPIVLDHMLKPFSASVLVYVAGGVTTSTTLSYTLDDPKGFATAALFLANAVWVQQGSAITATTLTTFSAPVTAVKLNVASLSGGNVVLKAVQAGPG